MSLLEDLFKALETSMHFVLFFVIALIIVIAMGVYAMFSNEFNHAVPNPPFNATSPIGQTLTGNAKSVYENYAQIANIWIYALIFGILFLVAFLVVTAIRQEE